MTLVPVSGTSESSAYSLKLETKPKVMKAGKAAALRFQIFHPRTGVQVNQFNVVHEKPFHLFIISPDLQYFNHIHPTQETSGSFNIDVTLPKPGSYQVFCDFFPTGGKAQVISRTLSVRGNEKPSSQAAAVHLGADDSRIKSINGIRFELQLEPAQPIAGQPTLLKYYLVDDQAGTPVRDLQPYLGAWGHSVTLREGADDFLHSHSTRLLPTGLDPAKLAGGPRVSFNTFFAKPGVYRIWSQFQRHEQVITVSFDVSVSRLDRIAKWDGRHWATLVTSPINGFDGPVRALAVSGNKVYVGGAFTSIDGKRVNGIACWNGQQWSDLGGGVNGAVWALASHGKDLIVAGEFTSAGGREVNHIARWNGESWSLLGTGVSGNQEVFHSTSIYALAISGNNVYAGGRFSRAGDALANGIAKWDGQRWASLGTGVRTGIYEGVVRALALQGESLYVGGEFMTADNVPAHNIAKWNGDRWSSLAGGVRGNLEQVLAISVNGQDLYVGGIFTTAGGLKATNIAKWNGHTWSQMNIEPLEAVRNIVVDDRNIYLAGNLFALPGGAVVSGVAKWDGKSWSGLGHGLGNRDHSGPVMAIATSGKDLFIGGDGFALSGMKLSNP
jgi:hypothetical protein